jgi:hypothetical protein
MRLTLFLYKFPCRQMDKVELKLLQQKKSHQNS